MLSEESRHDLNHKRYHKEDENRLEGHFLLQRNKEAKHSATISLEIRATPTHTQQQQLTYSY
jgi:hypothetical protein